MPEALLCQAFWGISCNRVIFLITTSYEFIDSNCFKNIAKKMTVSRNAKNTTYSASICGHFHPLCHTKSRVFPYKFGS